MVLLFRCGPPTVSKLPKLLGEPQCHINWPVIYPLAILMSAVNSASYLILVAIPALIVFRKGSLSSGARTSVAVLLGLAIVGLGISITRCSFMECLYVSPTFWRRIGKMWVFSATETTIGTIIISLATLKSLAVDWKHRLVRRVAHLRGREYSGDSIDVRVNARRGLVPTTTYSDIQIDEEALRRIGVLPEIDEDLDSYIPRKPAKAWHMSQLSHMPSISEIMYIGTEPQRKHSTV